MATEFRMPKLGLTMEAGTIIEWLVPDGAEVTEGDAVLLIETDKVESEVEASGAGLLHITGAVGQSYDCGEEIGWFLAPDESPPAAAPRAPAVDASVAVAAPAAPAPVTAAPSGASGGRLLASPNARRVAAERGVDLRTVEGSGPGGRITSEDVPVSSGAPPAGGAVLATIAARQLADLLGVDLAAVAAHGPDPRINRDDVARHVRERLARATASPARSASKIAETPLLQEPTTVQPMTGMRGTIAGRMHASLQEMAQLTLTTDVSMAAVKADRQRRDPKPGYTDYVLVAVAAALREHPQINSQVTTDGLAWLPGIHLGMAVAIDDGLVVPVVRDADRLAIDELASQTSRLAGAAREGSLSVADMEGGTFSVSTLGMFGVDAFTPVINPPNTAILGVGRLRDDDGMTLSLTWDHRAFDGAPAARFAASVRDRLEQWADG